MGLQIPHNQGGRFALPCPVLHCIAFLPNIADIGGTKRLIGKRKAKLSRGDGVPIQQLAGSTHMNGSEPIRASS